MALKHIKTISEKLDFSNRPDQQEVQPMEGASMPTNRSSDHLVHCHGNPPPRGKLPASRRFQPITASPDACSPLNCYPSRPRLRCVLLPGCLPSLRGCSLSKSS